MNIVDRIRNATWSYLAPSRSTSVAAAAKTLGGILQETLLARYAMSRRQSIDAASMFPTAGETALVEAALVCANHRPPSSNLGAEPGHSPLPHPAVLYQTLMAERYRFSLAYDRQNVQLKFAAAWPIEVDQSTNALLLPYESSMLKSLLAIPRVGHAALGSLLLDALHLLRKVIGIPDVWLSGGTLLGAVRHVLPQSEAGSFIPWDDDLDVTITTKGEERLLSFFGLQLPTDIVGSVQSVRGAPFEVIVGKRHWVVEHCPLFGYKAYDRNCTLPYGCPALLERGAMCFGAFVDIFVVTSPPDDAANMMGGGDEIVSLDRSDARATWPAEQYRPSATFPLSSACFRYPNAADGAAALCECELPVPNTPHDYLDRLYSAEWSRTAVVPQQLHYGLVLPSPLRVDRAGFLL